MFRQKGKIKIVNLESDGLSYEKISFATSKLNLSKLEWNQVNVV